MHPRTAFIGKLQRCILCQRGQRLLGAAAAMVHEAQHAPVANLGHFNSVQAHVLAAYTASAVDAWFARCPTSPTLLAPTGATNVTELPEH